MDLESDHGDPIILLNAFKQWLELKSDGQNTNTRQWCKRRGFEEQRFYEMTKLRRQFKDLLDVNIILHFYCNLFDIKTKVQFFYFRNVV